MLILKYSQQALARHVVFCLLTIVANVSGAAPETYDVSMIKSAYVFNFIRYVTWPNESAVQILNIGFYGEDEAYYRALKKMHGKRLRGFTLDVKKLSSLANNKVLHVLVVAEGKSFSLSGIAKKLQSQATLLVSEKAQDKKNTMLNFVSTAKKTLSFELNRYNMLNAKLKVSPDILVLGGTELDIANVLKEMDDTIASSSAKLESQSEKLDQLQIEIQQRENLLVSQKNKISEQLRKLSAQGQKLSTQGQKLSGQSYKLQAQNQTLNLQKNSLVEQMQRLKDQTARLKDQAAELALNKQKFSALKADYAELNQELEKSRIQLAQNTKNLLDLKKEIQNKEASISGLSKQISDRRASLQALYAQQEKLIEAKELEISENISEMAKQSSVIRTQYSVLIFAGVGLFSVLVMVGVIYHSSREKQRANKLLQANLQELALVNRQLKDAQSQLVEVEKMAALGSLVAGVAHEINTPLGVGVTAASLLSDRINEFNKEYQGGQLKRASLDDLLSDAKESSEMITRNLYRASELVRNFKQVAVDQSGETMRQFELKAYLEELNQSLYPQLKHDEHRIIIQAEENINLDSYPGVVAQVMTNLIMNSVIHGFKAKIKGEIHILLTLVNAQVCIDYQDDGVGLNSEQQEKVFEPFYTTVRGTGGSGLGMSISYNLVVNKLKGSIDCIDSPEGAHFKITFPVS